MSDHRRRLRTLEARYEIGVREELAARIATYSASQRNRAALFLVASLPAHVRLAAIETHVLPVLDLPADRSEELTAAAVAIVDRALGRLNTQTRRLRLLRHDLP